MSDASTVSLQSNGLVPSQTIPDVAPTSESVDGEMSGMVDGPPGPLPVPVICTVAVAPVPVVVRA